MKTTCVPIYLMLFYYVTSATQGVAWSGMENGMKWNGNFGMEYGRCQNVMEWKISRMEWKTIFHTNSILDFANGIYKKYIRMVITKYIRKRLEANHLSTY